MAEVLSDHLYRSLREAIADGETIPTVANGRPNRVERITRDGAYIETEKSRSEGQPARLVPAWMIQQAWDHLAAHGSLTNEYLRSTKGLNVKRSSAVCALLARLPDVLIASTRPIKLELPQAAGPRSGADVARG